MRLLRSDIAKHKKLSSSSYKISIKVKETFAKCSILFEFKEGENFNQRNIFNISKIKI